MGKALERRVEINGSPVRVLEKGSGQPLALIMGFGGAAYWPEFAELLSDERHVHLISLPGQHGSERGHDHLHTPLDWIVATIEILERGLPAGRAIDLVTCSAAGILGPEIAALAPQLLRSLTLIGPLGLYDEKEPIRNPYAEASFNRPKVLMVDKERYKTAFGPPADADEAAKREFDTLSYRNDESIARLMWPFGDIKGVRRLHRIKSTPVMLIWGEHDQVVPKSYAETYRDRIPARTYYETIAGAGHLATFDKPEACARVVLKFLAECGSMQH